MQTYGQPNAAPRMAAYATGLINARMKTKPKRKKKKGNNGR